MIAEYNQEKGIANMDPVAFHLPSSVAPPPLTHPPPQIFGSYIPEDPTSLHQHQLPPDFAAQMFPSDQLFSDEPEGAELKKRRISRACDMCRKKKIKCDGKLPACAHCTNSKTNCVFTQTEKKRAPPKGAKYIEGLENRLGRMEHLLRLSGLLGEDEDDLGALEKRLAQKSRPASLTQTSGPPTPFHGTPAQDTTDTPESSLTSPGPIKENDGETESNKDKDKEAERDRNANRDHKHKPPAAAPGEPREDVEALSEMMCSLVTNQSGESRYIGSSSGFSIFSPQGVQWINSKTGDDSFRRMVSHVSEDDHKWTNWKPEVFGDFFQRPIFRPLPPKEEALSLLSDYFSNFNCMLPLFHQPTFMHLAERQYSSDPYQGAGWWASLNVTLAIVHRIRVMSGVDPAEEDEKGWAYLKNAMGCFSELTLRSADLWSVQALVGMALFLQGTPNPQPVFSLIAAAVRLSHSIGLHKKGTGFDLNPIEILQRKRVFWIIYMLDKDICLRSGQPPAQDDEDMSVELPDPDDDDNIGIIPLADGKGKMSLFRVLSEFAIIQSNVYKRLYSAKASRQSEGELLQTIGELDEQLEEWKEKIPLEFRPDHPIQVSHTPLSLYVVTMHFSYYNCLITIHRMSIQHGLWTSRLANYAIQGLNARPLKARVFSSAALCTSAARSTIALLKYIPQGDFPSVWMILYFPVSALVTLFANILQNPLEANAKSDCKSMTLVVNFLSMLGQEAEQGGVHRMLGVCSEFCRVAESVVEKAQNDHSSRRKRKSPDGTAASAAAAATTTTTTAPASVGSKAASSMPLSLPNPPHQTMAAPPTMPVDHLPPTSSSTAQTSAYQGMMGIPSTTSQPGSSPSMDWSQDFHPPPPHEAEYHNQYGYGLNGALPPLHQLHEPPPPQQPLIPGDLFALQMSLDWNWAEMSGGAYPSVENGNFAFANPNAPPQHHRV